jgi:hypothetical protein
MLLWPDRRRACRFGFFCVVFRRSGLFRLAKGILLPVFFMPPVLFRCGSARPHRLLLSWCFGCVRGVFSRCFVDTLLKKIAAPCNDLFRKNSYFCKILI